MILLVNFTDPRDVDRADQDVENALDAFDTPATVRNVAGTIKSAAVELRDFAQFTNNAHARRIAETLESYLK